MKPPILISDERSLREKPQIPSEVRDYIAYLESQLLGAVDPMKQVSLLGEIGSYLRILEDLTLAEEKIQLAMNLIETHKLGAQVEIQQKIRLAHIYQWKQDFEKSNTLFNEIIAFCRESSEAQKYLHFALQHAGKNFFDQQRYAEALTCFIEALKIRRERNAPLDQIESTKRAIEETKRRNPSSI